MSIRKPKKVFMTKKQFYMLRKRMHLDNGLKNNVFDPKKGIISTETKILMGKRQIKNIKIHSCTFLIFIFNIHFLSHCPIIRTKVMKI